MVYQTLVGEPRAAIYAHKHIPLWINHDLSDEDNAACLWVTKEQGLSRVLVISSYWDRFLMEAPAKLTKAVEYAAQNNYEKLIGADTNAHSTLTGSSKTDGRGKILEDFILKYNLDIVNRGNEKTFESHLGRTCIDVTLASPNLASKIQNWTVNTSDNHSDHNDIEFSIDTKEPPTVLKRNFNNFDSNTFKARVEAATEEWTQPEHWDKVILEEQNEKLTKIITDINLLYSCVYCNY